MISPRTTIDHVHGVAHPRCDHPDCRAATHRYYKGWRYDVAHGNHRTMSAERVVLHIAVLQGQGWTLRAIAGEAGTSATTLSGLLNGQQTVTKRIAARILAVDPAKIPQTASSQTSEPFVSRVGTVRRLRALMAIGWSAKALSEHSGRSEHWFYNLLHQQGRWVTRSTHDEVAGIYRALSGRPGPSEIARRRSAARGYVGPTAWDDIDRDPEPDLTIARVRSGSAETFDLRLVDSDTEPFDGYDEAVVQRFIDSGERTRQLTHAEGVEVVRRLRAHGVSTFDMKRTYGLKPERYNTKEEAS